MKATQMQQLGSKVRAALKAEFPTYTNLVIKQDGIWALSQISDTKNVEIYENIASSNSRKAS